MVRSDGPGQPVPDGGEPSDEDIRALLADLAPLTAPDQAERARIRERVLAGLAKPSPSPRTPSPRPARAGRAPRGRRTAGAAKPGDAPKAGFGARGRFAVAAVAVLALVFSLAGMSLLLARDALPGDPLYGVKRTGEAASLGLTFGDEDRALKHLEFATARITELETLAQRYAEPADAPLRAYLAALTDFDHDAAAGSRALIAVATAGRGGLLRTLGEWAEAQRMRLGALRVPTAALTPKAGSIALLERIAIRAGELSARLPCAQVTSGGVDEVGALPASAPCEPAQAPGPPSPTAPPGGPTATGGPRQPLDAPTTPGGAGPEPTAPSGTAPPLEPSTPATDPTTTADSVPPLPLPTIGVPALVPVPGTR